MQTPAEYRRLRKEGRLTDALALGQRMIPGLAPDELTQLARLISSDLAKAPAPSKTLKVLILGQCTTTYLLPLITACAWAEGLRISLREGAYDQVMQDLVALEDAPDLIILLPWHQRLLADDPRSSDDRIADELSFLQQAWAQVARLKSKLVQISYDSPGPGAAGYAMSPVSGARALTRAANDALRAALPPGAFLIDLENISAWHGRTHFYDERNYHWLKQPFSPSGLAALSRHLATALRVLTSGRKKVLALDLDNTLWGGVVGEVGPHGITLGGGSPEGESFLAFQKYARRLKESGVLLAVCSKNNEDDALAPFQQNDQMALHRDDFASFHASWDTKPVRLRRIAEELNLGLDSFVFFDDNPAEREHVRAELPEVMVIEAPPDPALYIRALQESLAFEAAGTTATDADRSSLYKAESFRKEALSAAASPDAYLASLQMHAGVEDIGPSNLDRVVDLITKTNQFNLTTRRHSRAAVEAILAIPGNISFALTLTDKFGAYGLISVVLALPHDAQTLSLDTWLMSCRAMGRTVEYFALNHLVAQARSQGCTRIRGEFIPTTKNAPVQSLLPNLGFLVQDSKNSGFYELALTSYTAKYTHVSA